MNWQVPDEVWWYSVATGAVLCAWSGVLLTAFTLPGIWIGLVGVGLAQWWSIAYHGADHAMFSWWSLGACVGLGIVAEIIEIVASAFGARKTGGSKKAAFASVIGAMIGALLGTFLIPIPVLGTILGAALGAGIGALLTEKHLGEKTWKDASKVGAGAAAGRLAATVVKVGIAALIALVLTVDAFF